MSSFSLSGLKVMTFVWVWLDILKAMLKRQQNRRHSKFKTQNSIGRRFYGDSAFFDNQDYFQYVEQLRVWCFKSCSTGIWLLTDYIQIEKICHLSGAKYPTALKEKIEPIKDR
jgi:5,10-methylenetetrahydrofolate reductase